MAKIVGIDLGTTYSLIAHMEGGQPAILRDEAGRTQVPSVVSVDDEQRFEVGYSAREHLVDRAEETVYSVKRFMGKAYPDIEAQASSLPFQITPQSTSVVRLRLGEKEYSPPEISAVILKELKRQAEARLGETIEKAVITVPAYFNDAQRQATRDAGRLAGLDVLRIINEPTAASLAYGLNQQSHGVIAVYDLGGGTFDISILKLSLGIFEVLATCGDTELGGDDLDRALLELAAGEIKTQCGYDANSPSDIQRLRFEAERVKCELSEKTEAEFCFTNNEAGVDYKRLVTREAFEVLIAPIIEKTRKACQQAMRDAGVEAQHISEVVLVGGSTRVPAVRQLVKDLFEREPHTELNPDEVVALGAAVQAEILSGNKTDMLLLDVTPLSLGIETYGNVMSTIIDRNTTVPTSAGETFTTFVDGQTNVAIHVLQGEREMASDNRSLARFTLKDIPPLPAGAPKIEVTFTIDADGILHVRAKDQRTGQEQVIEVQPSYGLSDEEVERMLLDSIENAESDFEKRQLIEARNDADTVIHATRKSLERGGNLLNAEERLAVDAGLEELIATRDGESHQAIRDSLTSFEATVRPLTERQLDDALKDSLKNRTVGDIQL